MQDTERTLTEVVDDADDQTSNAREAAADQAEPDVHADAPMTTPEAAGATSKPRRQTRGAKNAASASAAVGRAKKATASKPSTRSGAEPSGAAATYIGNLRTQDEKRYATKTWKFLAGHRGTRATPFGLATARAKTIRDQVAEITGKRTAPTKPRAIRKARPATKPRRAAKKSSGKRRKK